MKGRIVMNAKQLQYAIQLSEVLNFSQVADQLGISQPALSKQIISLEQELGVRLFDRSTTPMTLTAAGIHFVREARELLYREDQLKRSMEDFRTGERGRLVIGISPFRSLYLMPPIVKKIQERYPGIQIILNEVGSDTLRKEVAEGKYDFAIINLPVDDSILDITPLEPDRLVLAVPNSMLDNIVRSGSNPVEELDIAVFRDLPFIAVGQNQEMRQLFEKLCAASDFTPRIAMEVVGVTTAWAMCRAGIGATLLPLQFVSDYEFDSSITLFPLRNTAQPRRPAVITRRSQYLSEYAAYALNLLINSKCQTYRRSLTK